MLHGVSLVPVPTGAPAWFAVSAQDMTERRHAEEELQVLSEHLAERVVRDPLTGLANRVLLEEQLHSALAREVGGRDPGAGRRDRGRGGVSMGLAVAVVGQAEAGALLSQADDSMYAAARLAR